MVLACRSPARGEALASSLRAEAAACGLVPPSLEVAPLDLASLASVRAFAAAFEARRVPLSALVNNAGVFDMGTHTPTLTPDRLEQHWATNFVAPSLLALLLLPSLGRGGGGRVVNVSSIMHRVSPARREAAAAAGGAARTPRPGALAAALLAAASRGGAGGGYTPTGAYADSKLAALLWSAELSRRLIAASPSSTNGVGVACVHPGNVLTNVVRTLPAAVRSLYAAVFSRVLLTPAEGARAVVLAAAGPRQKAGGGGMAALGLGGALYGDAACRPAPHVAAPPGDAASGPALWDYVAREAGVDADAMVAAAAAAAVRA